jgi:hypothetical protein
MWDPEKKQTKFFNTLILFPSAVLGIKVLLTTSAKHGGFQQWMDDMNMPSLVSILACMTILCTSALIAMSVLRGRGVNADVWLREKGCRLLVYCDEDILFMIVHICLATIYVHAMELWGRRMVWPGMVLASLVFPNLLDFIALAARSDNLSNQDTTNVIHMKGSLIRFQCVSLIAGLLISFTSSFLSLVLSVLLIEFYSSIKHLSKNDIAFRVAFVSMTMAVSWAGIADSPFRFGFTVLVSTFLVIVVGWFVGYFVLDQAAELGAMLCSLANQEVVIRRSGNVTRVYMGREYLLEGVVAFAAWICTLALIVVV